VTSWIEATDDPADLLRLPLRGVARYASNYVATLAHPEKTGSGVGDYMMARDREEEPRRPRRRLTAVPDGYCDQGVRHVMDELGLHARTWTLSPKC